jgi:hypothetical protein
VRWHTERHDPIICAEVVGFWRRVAAVAVQDTCKKTKDTYHTVLCMLIEELNPVKSTLIICPAIIG